MSNLQTDNSHFSAKVKLREIAITNLTNCNVLDLFSGDGLLWREVKAKHPDKQIQVLSIDKKNKEYLYLKGDNRKYLKSLNLNNFQVVDMDAYGVPFDQLDYVLNSSFRGIIIVTFINSIYGRLPHKLMFHLGITIRMLNKCQTLFYRNPEEKLFGYLKEKGINSITGYFLDRKKYFYFIK